MKCASCVNISICSEMTEKLPDDCEYYQEKFDRHKKPEKLRKPRKKANKKMTIDEIVAECKKSASATDSFRHCGRSRKMINFLFLAASYLLGFLSAALVAAARSDDD